MKNEPLVVERTYNVLPERVWQALTDKDQMKQWYFDISDFKPEPGFTFSFRGQGKEGEEYLHLCTIQEVIPNEKLKYSWRYDGFEGISFVTFELFGVSGKTKLRLTHEGLESFPAHPAFAKENFQKGWDILIGTSLKDFVEG